MEAKRRSHHGVATRSEVYVPGTKRVLVLHAGEATDVGRVFSPDVETVNVQDVATALHRLQGERFDGLFADVQGVVLLQDAGQLLRADQLLETLADGVVLVDGSQRITWANAEFTRWCGSPPEGKSFQDAIDAPQPLSSDFNPFDLVATYGPSTTCLQIGKNRQILFHVTPIKKPCGTVTHFVGVGRDVTVERQEQQKLDAIHQAGTELAALDPKELAKLSPEERVELLKANILKYSHDLLHYNVLEVRLLDPNTNRLEPLLTEGMTKLAVDRVLRAEATDNGVTGYVAATGKSYLCSNTGQDCRYLEGAAGAKSSLTVPLKYHDKVIGTFNVESPNSGAFTLGDQKFLEIFSREIADAIHNLELLVAEKRTTANQSVEAVRNEVAMPVDGILHAATSILDRYVGHDPETADQLQEIVNNARAIKDSIQKVGDKMAPPSVAAEGTATVPQVLRGKRVLVADNDERVRRAAHSLLGRLGCDVEGARDGKEAVLMARLGKYDAILADIRLPDLNGYEVFKQLQAVQPQVPIVFMSGYGYDAAHSIVKARQEGLRGVLFKPFRADQLMEVLSKLTPAKVPARPEPALV